MIKKRPILQGFTASADEYYRVAKDNKILRFGIGLDTPSCNWNCPYCYASDDPRKEKFHIKDSSINNIKKWIDEGLELGLKSITINGVYEPTTNKNYMNIIQYCNDKNIFVTLVTNGSLLTRQIIKKLYDFNISILIKLNVPIVSKNDKNYQKYAQIQSKLAGKTSYSDNIYDNILKRLDWLEEAGFTKIITKNNQRITRLGVESVIVKENVKYLPILAKQLRDRNIYTHFEVVKVQGQATKYLSLVPTYESVKEMFYKIRDDDILDGYENWIPKPPYIAGTCYQNLIRVNIAPNGDITPCPGIDQICGSLKNNTLDEIIKNSEVLHIVRNLEKYIEGDCKECELFQNRTCYGGCRGTVFQELKQKGYSLKQCLVGSDPSCWRVKKILD